MRHDHDEVGAEHEERPVLTRGWSVALFFVAVATAIPLFAVRYLPFPDLPEHVAAMATVARLLPGGGGDPSYVLSFGQSQYLLYDLLGAVLTRLIGDAVLANRVLLAILAIAWPYAFRSLVRALGRDERLALFAPMLFWNRALTIGFLPFVGSVPLALVAMAMLVRHLEKPTRGRSIGLAVLALLLFYAHVSTYVLLGAAGGVFVLARVVSDRKTWKRGVLTLALLVPSGLCALAWWRTGSLEHVPGQMVSRISGGAALDAAPIWAFDLWRSHQDELWTTLWWTAFGAIVIDGLRRKPDVAALRNGGFALIPLACTVLVYVVTPFHVGAAGFLDVRLAPLLALFSLLVLRPSFGRLGQIELATAVVATLGTVTSATFEMRRVEREMLGDFATILDAMRPDTRLALLNFESRSPQLYFWPYVFAGSYHRLQRGTIVAYSFNELAHWPVHFAPDQAPPKHGEFWTYHPCEFRHRSDGTYYDYVLVQGRLNPFALPHPGPEFVPIAHAGVFTLFAKDHAIPEPDPDAPDRSVCRRRVPRDGDDGESSTAK